MCLNLKGGFMADLSITEYRRSPKPKDAAPALGEHQANGGN
jgi:hypothetical protein